MGVLEMHDMHALQLIAKQVMEERHRDARREALAARHSRAGLMRRFVRTIAGRAGDSTKEVR